MKSFDQFQNESFVGRAVGLMNKAATAAKGVAQKAANIKVAKPTTGPLVAPKKPTPGQIARSNPAAKAAALRKQTLQNKAAQQPKKTTTVATPVTKGPFTQTTKSGNKDMPGKMVKVGSNPNNKPPITGKQIGDFVKKVGSKVQQGAAKVNQIRKDTQPAREKARTGVAKFMASKNVRQGLSKLNQTRKALPTAADYRTGQEGEGSGFGGSFSGRSVRGVSKALGAQGKEFEDSETKIRKGAGRNRPQEVVQRGRELDSDGKPIEKRRDTSFKGALGKMVDRATMTTDKKAKKPKPQEPKSKVTAVGVKTPKTPSDSGAAKVTSGKGQEKDVSKPKVASNRPTDKDEKGDTDKIDITGGRQQRITGGSDPVPIKQGREAKRRGRPPGSRNKTPVSPGQLSLLDGESKVKTDSKKKEGEGLGSKVGKAVKTGAKKVGKAVKDKAVQVGKGIKDEVVSGAKELSKDIEKKVAAGKEKRDASRKATKDNVTTNYTEPKKGEEMKVPEKKDKVTVNTSKDTAKDREKQKKQAPKALAQAVARRSEADAAKDAVKDMRQSGQKVTDDVRSQLSKTLSKTESDPDKSTQLKGVKDEDLTRKTTPSGDEGSFRRSAKKTNKKLGPKAAAKYAKYENRTPEEEAEAQQKMFNKKSTPKSLQGAERATNKEIDKLRKKDTYGKKKTINPNASKTTGKKTVKKKLNTNKKKEEASESFSHWREEFIWETDKKYPEKIKEIKPMSGKNNITINPEDETSKYKRGY